MGPLPSRRTIAWTFSNLITVGADVALVVELAGLTVSTTIGSVIGRI